MLLQFSLTNHRSIKKEAQIHLQAARTRHLKENLLSPDGKTKILPVLAFFGANGAGKSSLLHGLWLMKEMTTGKYAQLTKGELLPQEPFAFTDQTPQPTRFEVVYYYEGIRYVYGFCFDRTHIIEEYLYHWPKGRKALIFHRQGQSFRFTTNIREQKILASRTAENRLYLVTSNCWNLPQTEKAYFWFTRKLMTPLEDQNSLARIFQVLRSNPVLRKQMIEQFKTAGFNIVDMEISGTEDDPLIWMIHELKQEDGTTSRYALNLKRESKGTRKFFSILPPWIQALENGGVLVMDDLDTGMHPLLGRYLIQCLQDPVINTQKAQLLLTSQDLSLLDAELLGRDQIWFAQKDPQTAETKFYTLEDFPHQKKEKIACSYLWGHYGAIPFLPDPATQIAAPVTTPKARSR